VTDSYGQSAELSLEVTVSPGDLHPVVIEPTSPDSLSTMEVGQEMGLRLCPRNPVGENQQKLQNSAMPESLLGRSGMLYRVGVGKRWSHPQESRMTDPSRPSPCHARDNSTLLR